MTAVMFITILSLLSTFMKTAFLEKEILKEIKDITLSRALKSKVYKI